MSNLDKVLIIWNDPVKPPDDLKWPTIHVPVQVVEFYPKTKGHSNPAIKCSTKCTFGKKDELLSIFGRSLILTVKRTNSTKVK